MKYKRYPKYKDSGLEWLAQIPAHWERMRLKFLVENVTCKSNLSNDDLPYVGLENIESFTGRWVDSIAEGAGDGTATRFAPEHVLFGKLRPYLSKAFLPSFHGQCSTEFLVFRPKALEKKFLFYLLLTDEMLKRIDSSSYGTKMPRASWGFIGNLPVVVPNPREQGAISRFLDHETANIDALVVKKQRLIELLQEKRSALITRAVTKGLDPNVPMKNSSVQWLGELPEHWEVKRIKRVAKVIGRIGFRGYSAEDLVGDGEGALTLGASQVADDGSIDLSSPVFLSWEKYYESPEIMLSKDDILIVQRGSCGRVAHIQEELGEATINPSLVVLKNLCTSPRYLFYSLSSSAVQNIFGLFISSTAVPMLSQEQIESISISLSTVQNENVLIAESLDHQIARIDMLVSKIHTAIAKLKEYRSALISAAVTGKIDVREEAG